MAQMIARADAHKDEVTVEQKEMIQRLANEFANELQAFGVRVNKLENQVGNFKFSGDLRLKYENVEGHANPYTTDGKSAFAYRGRLKVEGSANESTKAVIRLSTGDTYIDEEGQSGTSIDEVYLQHKFNENTTVKLGRQEYVIGNGLAYDERFDGVVLQHQANKIHAEVAYGNILDNKNTSFKNSSVIIYQLGYQPTSHIKIKGFYLDRRGYKYNKYQVKPATDIFGGALDLNFGYDNKIWVGGEYIRKASSGSQGEAWTVGIGYGKLDIAKPGSWEAKAQYFSTKNETFVKYTTYKLPIVQYNSTRSFSNYKGWLATVDYTLVKNLTLTGYASFNSRSQTNEYRPETYRVDLNYQF